ncbi:MAG: hypothetical protein ACYDAR_06445 [Thermomicrobiales bacterium]
MRRHALGGRILILGFLGLVVLVIVGWGIASPTPNAPASLAVASPTPRATSTAASPTKLDASTPAQGFMFIFEYGLCTTNKLNTALGLYTAGGAPGLPGTPDFTIPLVLTAAELDTIHQKMVDINFFNYPAQFAVPVGPGTPTGIVTPSATYHWIVNDGTQAKEVRWHDEIFSPTTVEAERLRELAKLMKDIIEAHPEMQQLPNIGGCA